LCTPRVAAERDEAGGNVSAGHAADGLLCRLQRRGGTDPVAIVVDSARIWTTNAIDGAVTAHPAR
jgi:hypothetical protein